MNFPNSIVSSLTVLALLLTIVLSIKSDKMVLNRVELIDEACPTRKKISFILGQDKTADPYFQFATEFYLSDSLNASDVVISSCRTLECVINYLNQHPDTLPWAEINLVAHGNPTTGLNLFISKDGHKATPKRLVQEFLLDTLPSVEANVLDSFTQLNVFSCGIGKSKMINFALPRIFKNINGQVPRYFGSPYFVVFRPDESGLVRKYNALYWPYYYKRGLKPSNKQIANEMAKLYPDTKLDWNESLNSPMNQLKSMEYHLPISYTKIYEDKDDRPDLSCHDQKISYITQNEEVMEMIESSGIPMDKYKWTVEKRKLYEHDGTIKYAVKVLGMTTVICFLEEQV